MIRPLYIIAYIIIIALFAQLAFDLNLPNVSIPVSGQTLAILTGAVFLKPLESFLGIIGYCLIGIAGVPVFADGGAGWETFSGGSLGYFIGFLLGALFVSTMAMRRWNDTIWELLAIMLMGTLIILLCGTAILISEHGLIDGFSFGFTPFLLGGIVKSILSILIILVIQKFELLPSLPLKKED